MLPVCRRLFWGGLAKGLKKPAWSCSRCLPCNLCRIHEDQLALNVRIFGIQCKSVDCLFVRRKGSMFLNHQDRLLLICLDLWIRDYGVRTSTT